jgi:hypothetical protein
MRTRVPIILFLAAALLVACGPRETERPLDEVKQYNWPGFIGLCSPVFMPPTSRAITPRRVWR